MPPSRRGAAFRLLSGALALILLGWLGLRVLAPGRASEPPAARLPTVAVTPVQRATLEARVTLDAMPHRPREGRVIHVNPAANPQSRSFIVRVRLDNADLALKPGMYGKVTFPVRVARGALVVPGEAVMERDGASFVYVLEGDRVRRAAVKVGMKRDGRMEITEGVRAGERVVVMGQERLEDGDRVLLENQRS